MDLEEDDFLICWLVVTIYQLLELVPGINYSLFFAIGQATIIHFAFCQFAFNILVLVAVYFYGAIYLFPFVPVIGIRQVGNNT